jgi:predicted Zn finger-like uncharacterized protein
MARTTCPECAARVRLPDAAPRGRRVRCAACGAVFDPGAADSDRPGRGAGSGPRPRKRRKRGGIGPKGAALLIGGAAAAVLALALVVVGVVLISSGRAGPGGGLPGSGGLPGIAGGPPGVNPLVSRENARKVAQDMTVAQADAILGPGRACTLQEIADAVERDYGGLYVAAATPTGRGDESSWRLWQSGSMKVMAGFYKSKAGVERVCSVRFTDLAPGGAIEYEEVFSSP